MSFLLINNITHPISKGNPMNYEKLYHNLITSRGSRQQISNIYYEKHHILPKCKGGLDTNDNLVSLTAREHYIAHVLLYKMETDCVIKSKLAYALRMMMIQSMHHANNRQFTSHQYALGRAIFSEHASVRMSGENNPFYGKTHSTETRQKMSNNCPDRSGEKNGMYGRKHSEDSRKKMSESTKGTMMGDNNPSKRPEVREKIRQSKLGANNPKSSMWEIIEPDGTPHSFIGGIKRKLIELGTTYMKAKNPTNGWVIRKLN